MTEVEFPRLLLELTETAKSLNRESDGINDLITRFESKLRDINLGLEVWLTDEPLSSSRWSEEDDRDGRTIEEGTHDRQLGFAKEAGGWHLGVRVASFRKKGDGWEFLNAGRFTKLRECSREERIGALKLFPLLAKAMKSEADASLKAIEDAKKFVK